MLDTNVSFAALLAIVPPSGGTNVRVAPFSKFAPLISIVWLLLLAGYDGGLTFEIDGVYAAAVTENENAFECRALSALLTVTLQFPASLPLLNW